MAAFLLRSREGSSFAPPPCVAGAELFADVPAANPFCPWVEELARRGITSGCAPGSYCPASAIQRRQMAVFLLRTLETSGYQPPAATGIFSDVPASDAFAPWIEELYRRGITGGCATSPLRFCPLDAVTRGQMSAFLSRTFGLGLYGP